VPVFFCLVDSNAYVTAPTGKLVLTRLA
jgi:hypothetical protein